MGRLTSRAAARFGSPGDRREVPIGDPVGLSGRRDQLENPLGYLYRTADIRHPNDLHLAIEGLGEDLRFAEEYFDERYPTDGFQLTRVHVAFDVRRQHQAAGIDPGDPWAIEQITVGTNLPMSATVTMYNACEPAALLDRVTDPGEPDWTYDALLFDGAYPVAAALVDGELPHRQYRDDRFSDAAIREVATDVAAEHDESSSDPEPVTRRRGVDGRPKYGRVAPHIDRHW